MTIAQAIFAAVLITASLLAMLNLLRGFRMYLREAKPEPVEPVEEVNPPEPVVKTPGVGLVAWVAMLWSVANLIALALGGTSLREETARIPLLVLLPLMIYFTIAAVLICWGGVMLLRLMAYGRRTIAWGVALFGVVNVFLFGLCLFLRQYRDTPTAVRDLMIPAAIVLAAHTVIGTTIGVAAQHVGMAETASLSDGH